MKTAILIGDSIRRGYQSVVQAELAGRVAVWGPEQNGRDSQNVLANLDAWVISRKPNIVHVNCGLHDIKRDYDSDMRAVPIEAYTANVRQILTRLQQETDATVIWAATTPVNYKRHHKVKGFDRFEMDVDAYNAAAVAVAEDLNIPINDLFSVIMNAGRDALLLPDGVHFWGRGYDLLGTAVAACIRRYL